MPEPADLAEGHVVVDVLAAALSPRVRSQAAGTHYTSSDDLPLIPGIDGVGRLPNGSLVYFLLPDTTKGSMAERTGVDLRRAIALQDDADVVKIAALMNPTMASWVALRRRHQLQPGQGVLILGATGNAGRAAIQVATHLGAGNVVAVGRGIHKVGDLRDLGASEVIDLDADPQTVHDELADAGQAIDVVLDFLWGEPTKNALYAIVPSRTDDNQQLTWIQVGSVAGLESSIPSAALRATTLHIIGSGQGSVPSDAYRQEIDALATEIHDGTFDKSANIDTIALKDVHSAWTDTSNRRRLVLVP